MSFTRVDLTIRPIKIGFIVDYGDKNGLSKALTMNSCLWGNRFNPIIPAYKRLPRNLFDALDYKFSTKKNITQGYFETFDPDYFVNLSSLPDAEIPAAEWQIIKESDIFETPARRALNHGRSEVGYGISLFEILDHVADQEFKYQRSTPLPVLDLLTGKHNSLFLGSVFGIYPERVRNAFMDRYSDTINIQTQPVSLSNYIKVVSERQLTVKQLANSYITSYINGGHREAYLFILDPSSWQDIVDYINLKALGFQVLALPLQICMLPDSITLAAKFIDENYSRYTKNQIHYETTVLKSRSCPEEAVRNFVDKLPRSQDPRENKWVYQNWHSRIWDSWSRNHNGGSACRAEHKAASHEVTDTNEIRVPSLTPDFIDDRTFWWHPKFACEIGVKTYDGNNFIANAFPTSIEHADRVLGKVASHDEWRFSRHGIVHLPDHQRETISFQLPSAEDLYSQWQKSIGIEAHVSNPGKLAEQIVRKMGADHLNILANEGLAKLVQRLASAKGGVKSIPYVELLGNLKRFTSGTIWFKADSLFKWLLHKGVIELGIDITCPTCNNTSWHTLKSLDNTVTCSICLESIGVGQVDPKNQLVWSYRPVGPFSVQDLARGAYTVVLTINFFAKIRDMNITPRYSFESKDKTYEADFGLLAKKGYQEEGIINIVGECKSFGRKKERLQFKDKEIIKLLKLGRKAKNSVIVFATLRRSLTESDKRRLTRLVYRLRESRLKRTEYLNVLILTGNELFVQHDLKDSWQALGGKHALLAKNINRTSIEELCDATQQLYLDVESLWEWYEAKRKSAQSARQEAKALSK